MALGLVLAWIAFDRAAALTGSLHGEGGLLVGAVAIAAVLLIERWLHGRPFAEAIFALGFGRPAARGLAAAIGVSALMLAFYPLFARATATPLGLRPGWPLLVPGLLAQGGVAEECLFRGYLFGRLRRTRSFWRAAWLSVPPFLAVHLIMLTYLPPVVAGAAVLLSLVLSFPLARLYDLGGRTLWPPAILHAVVQGAVKLVVAPEAQQTILGVAWMGVALVVPWLVFLVPAAPERGAASRPRG